MNEELQYIFSWTVISTQKISKKLDKSSFLYKMTGIPVDARWFFEIESLLPGKKKEVVFTYEEEPFQACFSMGVQESPRSRLSWEADFSQHMKARFPDEYSYLKAGNRDISEIFLIFEKRSPILYDVYFE